MATIEIDGKKIEVENGKMIIEVADEVGIYIPRFCYHKKLSVAANCRMCLVEVENGRKPVPACATPITNGMKVFTQSAETLRSQQAVMEFLLINHPLDCPVCDQGGECELQDISMGFGYDQSEYNDTKRAVEDDDLGPLIATEMTRCIHCTRCVRFGEEIAGLKELGGMGRGEDMQIGTYIKHSMVSEVSGNIIDLCPVGALTSKPFRFTARPWELSQHDSIAPHDCLGSNVHLHVRRNQLMRVVPKENESINETWLSDRDRFSYLGLVSKSRAAEPMIKRNGQWEQVDWTTALKFSADGIARILNQYGPEQFAAFASPSSTIEEFYLTQKLMRQLGVQNLDHRIQQIDFRDQDNQAAIPQSSLIYADLEFQNTILLFGCNIHREVPLAGLKVRKAFRNGAKIMALNSVDYEYHFNVTEKNIISPHELSMELAKIVLALNEEIGEIPKELEKILVGLEVDDKTIRFAEALRNPKSVIITGFIVENHPDASLLRTLIYYLEKTGIRILRLTSGANTTGACLAGMLPHRSLGGQSVENPGMDFQAALNAKLKGYFLLGLEPGYDFDNPYRTRQSMLAAEFVVMLTPFFHESMRDYADVILPMAPYSETSGTYLNIDGQWQTVKGAQTPFASSRPAWKILRVLGNLLNCKEFDYLSTEDILTDIESRLKSISMPKYYPYHPASLPMYNHQLVRMGEWPLYRSDMIVRNAKALQNCAGAEKSCIRINPNTAKQLNLDEIATVSQGDIEITLPLKRDERIAPDVVWIANAMPETIDLGHSFATITIKR